MRREGEIPWDLAPGGEIPRDLAPGGAISRGGGGGGENPGTPKVQQFEAKSYLSNLSQRLFPSLNLFSSGFFLSTTVIF